MPNIGPFEILFLLLLVVGPIVLIAMLVQRGRREACWRCSARVERGVAMCPACGAATPGARPPGPPPTS